jgi:hypothetical protein
MYSIWFWRLQYWHLFVVLYCGCFLCLCVMFFFATSFMSKCLYNRICGSMEWYVCMHVCVCMCVCVCVCVCVRACVQRQAWELILGPKLATRAWLLSFNRAQCRVVIGIHTGHNTLRRHLYVLGLSNNPIVGSEVLKGETSVHILCEWEGLASLRHARLGSFFLDPQDIRKLIVVAIWNCGKGTGLL